MCLRRLLVTLCSGFVLLLVVLSLAEVILDGRNEIDGLIKGRDTQLRVGLIFAIRHTLDVSVTEAERLIDRALVVSRVEVRATPWYDSLALVEATGWVETYGPFQIHWQTAADTARRWNNPRLSQFLGGIDLTVPRSKTETIRDLQLRGRGGVVLAILHIATLERHLPLTQQNVPSRVIAQTHQALRGCGRPLGRYTANPRTIADFVADSRARWATIHLMVDYAAGEQSALGADIQAMVNESYLLGSNQSPPLVVDGDPGRATWAHLDVVSDNFDIPKAPPDRQELRAIHAGTREWYERAVEWRVVNTVSRAAYAGDGPQLIRFLRNRYAGMTAYYTALAEVTHQLERIDPRAAAAVRRELNRRFHGWALERDPRFWHPLLHDQAFDDVFGKKCPVTRLTLLRLTAQLFLLHRLVGRDLGGEVCLTYRPHWFRPDVNPLGRILILAKENNWLISE